MPITIQNEPVEPGFDFGTLDTAGPLQDKPRKASKRPAPPREVERPSSPGNPFAATRKAPEPDEPLRERREEMVLHRPRAKGIGKWLGGKFATAVIANLAFMLFMHHVGLAKTIRVLCTIGATVAGRDKDAEAVINKVLDESKGVATTPKPTVVEKIKQAAERPVEVAKVGAKKAVDKVEGKADEFKAEVKEEATGIKDALQGLKAEPSDQAQLAEQQPGLLAQAGQKLTNAKDAVAGKVAAAFQGEQLTPAQAQKRRDDYNRAIRDQQRAIARRRNQMILGEMGRQQMAAAAGMAAQAEVQNQQRINDAFQWHNNMTEQVNRNLRGYR